MAGASTIPQYPAPKRKTAVTFTLTEGGNYVRVWCTNAPPGSELRTKIDGTADPRNRVLVYEGDGGANDRWNYVFDVGGVYTFAAQEYTKNATTFGGGYQGDPDGYPSETKVGNEGSVTISIGQRLTSEIRIGPDSLTLVLWVWGGTIRATTKATHGEISPALQAESPTPNAQAAMESSAIVALLDGLDGDAVSTAVGTPSTVFSGLASNYNAHRTQLSVHNGDDGHNVLPAGLSSAANAKNLTEAVNVFLRIIRQHYTNDAVEGGSDAGRDSGDYHNVSGKKNDNVNLPLYQSVSGPQDAYWALADIHRSLTAHFPSTAVHDAADNTNTPTALPALLAVASAILALWASTSPTTPATQSDGAMTLISRAGFDETPPEG